MYLSHYQSSRRPSQLLFFQLPEVIPHINTTNKFLTRIISLHAFFSQAASQHPIPWRLSDGQNAQNRKHFLIIIQSQERAPFWVLHNQSETNINHPIAAKLNSPIDNAQNRKHFLTIKRTQERA